MMEQKFTTVITDLSEKECNFLKSILFANEIPFIEKEHRHEYEKDTFDIKVERKNLELVRPIIMRQKVTMFLNSQPCPMCGHLGHRRRRKETLLLRIYLWRVMLLECKNCKWTFAR